MDHPQFIDILPLILSRKSAEKIVAFLSTSKYFYSFNTTEFWIKLIRTRWGHKTKLKGEPQIQYRDKYRYDEDLFVDSIYSDINCRVLEIVNRGIELDKLIHRGKDLLCVAVRRSNYTLVKLFLEQTRANLFLHYQKDRTILTYAVEQPDINITKLLLKFGAEIDKKDIDGNTLIHYCMNRFNHLSLFLDSGLDLNAKNNRGATPLHWAAFKGEINAAQKLLSTSKVELNPVFVEDGLQITPLHLACRKGCYEMVDFLLTQPKIKVTADNLREVTANTNSFVLEKLLNSSAELDLTMKGHSGRTLIMFCIVMRRLDLVKLLLNKGAPINQRDDQGNTELHYCIYVPDFDAYKLLSPLVDRSIANNKGLTVLDLIKEYGYKI